MGTAGAPASQGVGCSNAGLPRTELSRGLSVGSVVQMFAASCEIRLGGSRQLEPTSAFNHPPSKGVFCTFSRHWQGAKERCRDQMVTDLFERCLLWALVLQEKRSGDLGAQGTGKQFLHIQGSGACGGAYGTSTAFKATVKDVYGCKTSAGRAGGRVFASRVRVGGCVRGGSTAELTVKGDVLKLVECRKTNVLSRRPCCEPEKTNPEMIVKAAFVSHPACNLFLFTFHLD